MSSIDQLDPQEKQDTLIDTSVRVGESPGFAMDETNHWNSATTHSNTNDDDIGDFGDFGTAASGTTSTQNGGGFDNDDGFGDFGSAQVAGSGQVSGHGGGFGDDDDFGDFGQAQVVTGDSHGDDEFGDFNDFAQGDGDGAFQDSGDFGDFEETIATDVDDAFGAPEPAPADTHEQPTTQVEEAPTVEPAPDFTAVNSRQVETFVLEKLSTLYPIDDSLTDQSHPKLLNPELDEVDVATVLSDQDLWTALCEQSFQGSNTNTPQSPLSKSPNFSVAPQFQWKYSDLRKEYYASLGLTIAKEQSAPAPMSIPNTATNSFTAMSKVTSSMVVNTEVVTERKPLDIEATRAYCQFTRENLAGYSGDEIKDIITQLTDLTRQASDELTYWLDQREQMMMDSERYNGMIGSLVDRAAKLKDAESRQNTKTKRITRASFHLK
ncbi:hypothetical protein B0O80DRAFT_474070 [Mortierella sp. GBAus27b]|nr:hypothetical protein BGX31_010805 [Mortierella sp. GBA43]KAI8345402.1 hypothetical protein B0O80DRAFT_474070 [Mortierella sp. GBAus27b]